MFSPLHNIMNQELFKKHLRNQSSHYEKYGRFPLLREAITKSTPFAVSKDEWDTKEKNALYVLLYAKRHVSSWSDVKQFKKSRP